MIHPDSQTESGQQDRKTYSQTAFNGFGQEYIIFINALRKMISSERPFKGLCNQFDVGDVDKASRDEAAHGHCTSRVVDVPDLLFQRSTFDPVILKWILNRTRDTQSCQMAYTF